MHATPDQAPPSYDAVTSPETRQAHLPNPAAGPSYQPEQGYQSYQPDQKKDQPDEPVRAPATGPMSMPTPIPQGQVVPISSSGAGPSMPATPVYHYVHPVTGDQLASLLPPNHPAMICVQEGRHINQSSYGILGIMAAIIWFPLGVGLCMLDRRVKCRRCGQTVSSGLCD